MDDLLEFVLELIDNLTGNKLDYGIGRLTGKLTRNIKNEKRRKVCQFLIWVFLFILILAFLLVLLLLIEAWKTG